jgi:preprotein translocase subunit SecG
LVTFATAFDNECQIPRPLIFYLLMYTFITLLIVLISVLLILLVLVQKPKGGGLAQGSSSINQVMGVKRTTDAVEKGTWILSLSLLTLALLVNLWIPRAETSEKGAATRLEDKVFEAPAVGQPAPGSGGNNGAPVPGGNNPAPASANQGAAPAPGSNAPKPASGQ